MIWPVVLTHDAARDLKDIVGYVDSCGIPGRGDHVYEQIVTALRSLSSSPHRGVFPRELSDLGAKEFREIFFKPYRIIYKVEDKRVLVLLIADGRRDMPTLLQRRLLHAD